LPKNNKCRFIPRWPTYYTCSEPALEGSFYCIFHERSKNKDIENFREGIRDKISREDYGFTGYWFPEHTSNLFRGKNFKKDTDFQKATFKGEVDFTATTFQGKTFFRGCTFEENVFFRSATFEKEADFRGRAKFGRTEFEERVANFTETTFKRIAWFTGAIFNARVQFEKTTFDNGADFRQARFKSSAYFEELKIKGPLYLDKTTKFEQPKGADTPFRIAKVLWHREGNYVEEGKAHYQEMDRIRKQKRWDIRYIWANLFHRLLHGYGEKPHRVILWAVAIITGCALLFMNFGIGETRLFAVEEIRTYNICKILPKLYTLSWTDLANIGRYFYFSVVTFTTLGYGDLRPVHPISHLISSIEAFVGMFMMALFVLTFGRKWRR